MHEYKIKSHLQGGSVVGEMNCANMAVIWCKTEIGCSEESSLKKQVLSS